MQWRILIDGLEQPYAGQSGHLAVNMHVEGDKLRVVVMGRYKEESGRVREVHERLPSASQVRVAIG